VDNPDTLLGFRRPNPRRCIKHMATHQHGSAPAQALADAGGPSHETNCQWDARNQEVLSPVEHPHYTQPAATPAMGRPTGPGLAAKAFARIVREFILKRPTVTHLA